MFCAPDEGAAAVVLCRADLAHRYTSTPIYLRATDAADPPLRRLRGARLVGGGRAGRRARPCTRRRPPTSRPGIGPEDVDVIQLQDTDAGAEVIHMAENGFCADGEQEKLIADGATEIDRPAAGQHRRRAHRQRRAHRRLRPAPGPRARPPAPRHAPATARSPASPRSATPSSTARPAPPASRSSRPEGGGEIGVGVSSPPTLRRMPEGHADPAPRWQLRTVPAELVERYVAEGWWTDDSPRAHGRRRPRRDGATRAFVVHSAAPAVARDVRRRRPGGSGARRRRCGRRGVGPGDVVVFQLPNWVEAGITFWGAAYVGAVVVPVVHFYGAKEVGYILARHAARAS